MNEELFDPMMAEQPQEPDPFCGYYRGCNEKRLDGSRYCAEHATMGMARENYEARTPHIFAAYLRANHELSYEAFLHLQPQAQKEIIRNYRRWLTLEYAPDDGDGCGPMLILLAFGISLGYALFGRLW